MRVDLYRGLRVLIGMVFLAEVSVGFLDVSL